MKCGLESIKTAQLWLEYLEMVAILKKFMKAERLGDWKAHLESLNEMLQYLAASGHNLYTKSVRLYLQKMSELKDTHPDVQQKFDSGHHVARRSDRRWSGLSTDLMIEQVLMKSMKTTGGLIHGRGISEKQRLTWLLSMPACSEVNCAMQEFTGVKYNTSEQHKEMGHARQVRDTKDTEKVEKYIEERNPFQRNLDTSLFNIVTGVAAAKEVNVCDVKQIGQKILNGMTGKSVDDYVFKKKDQLVPMSIGTSVSIEEEHVHIDPQLLFQRLLTVARANENDLMEALKYELCSIPPALFDNNGMLCPANKPALLEAIWKLVHDVISHVPEADKNLYHVLDGGALLQLLPWIKGQTYSSLCDMYIQYVCNSYQPNNTTIVFDGYPDRPTTKDITHLRRSKGMKGSKVNLKEDMPCHSSKELFLSNRNNKHNFISSLGLKLKTAGLKVIQADEDADLVIAQEAVKQSSHQPTVVVADDTDVLVLLLYHAKKTSKGLYFERNRKTTSKKYGPLWNIDHVKDSLGEDVCSYLLFIHALLGCDTTSSLFGFGKGMLAKLLKRSDFANHAAVFRAKSCKSKIVESGEAILLSMYGSCEENLNILRYKRFCEKVATNTVCVEPKKLPPTSSAAKYHLFRVYYQVQQWMGNSELDPCDWG